tara:strand:+ start:188 stop:490 length:303 start_codon:yes stop_codon:yes gene_type:complete
MAYQVIYDIQGEGLKDSTNVFDQSKEKGATVIDIFNNYVANDWITQYDRKDITETHVEDTLVFVSKEKRDSWKAETEAARGENDSDITNLTVTVKEEGEV